MRRGLMVPLVVLGAVALLAAWAVSIPVSLLVCPIVAVLRRRRPRWRVTRILTMAAGYAVAECVCILLACVLWVVSGFGLQLTAGVFVAAHGRLLRAFLGALMGLARPVFGFALEVIEPHRHPEDLLLVSGSDPIVVLARHAGPGASFALVHLLVSRYHRRVRVVLKEALRLDPALDLLLSRTGATWVGSGPDATEQIRRTAGGLAAGEALLLFPEGADWTPVRHLAAVARLRRRGLVGEARLALRMPHVLPPRPAGTVAALVGAPSAPVLVFTHAGHDELLDAGRAWQSLPLRRPLQMAWWQGERPGAVDTDQDRVLAWLRAQWTEIDLWIGEQDDLADLRDID